MSEARTFNCPSCGSQLSPQGDAAEIKCPYCGNTVIVPEELRARSSRADVIEATPVNPDYVDNASASKTASSPFGVLAGIVVVFVILGLVGWVVFGSLGGSVSLGVAPTALPSPTPLGFASVALTFGGQGTAPGLFQDARNLAADDNGNVYVDDQGTLRVQKFDASGKYASGWTVEQSLCSNKSATLGSLAADRTGNVFVQFCGWILKYDGASGNLLDKFKGAQTSTVNDFYLDVSAYPDGGLLVLADGAPYADEVLLHLDANGKVLKRYTSLVTNQSPKGEAGASSLKAAADGLGNLFLLSQLDAAVYKFAPDGKFVTKFGSVGIGLGQFDAAVLNIAVDNQSRVYVTDFSGVKIFDSNGAYLTHISDSALKGIDDMRINAKNEIYLVGGQSRIFKLVLNAN